MQLRKTILCAILLAVGFILHQVVPAFAGVTFDIQLSM
ncbi:MAG TPA: tryptophan transporter, partial [Clostridiaceae bacterium]|nr:tryptophan transporter [Clostridiaceae bacterium]